MFLIVATNPIYICIMKLHAKIIESAISKNGKEASSIIIQFVDDKEGKNFEVFCPDFDLILHQN